MKNLQGLAALLLCTLLVACVNPARTFNASENRIDLGQHVAQSLTIRYANRTLYCDEHAQPAYFCSGILFRATRDNLEQPVWEVADKDVTRGAVTFAYLRADAKFKTLINGYTNGFIFKPYGQVPEALRPHVRCIFPMGADTNKRAEQGCGAYPSYPTSGPCHLNGVTTGQQWLTHFNTTADGRVERQCGFSLPPEGDIDWRFLTALDAMEKAGALSFDRSNELLLAPWAKGEGKKLPLEAFFYVADSSTGLAVARRNQQDLQDREGVLIPVIRITLPQTMEEQAKFDYNPDDQALPMPPVEDLGSLTAANLTERYADTATNCGSDSKPAFLCNGVMFRGTSNNPTYHVWNNSPAAIARGGVSFSYLRADAAVYRLAYTYNNGYIFNAYLHAEDKLGPEVLCFFPTDADSVNRTGKGCGPHKGSSSSDLCHLNGVTTAEQWWEHYTAHSSNRDEWQCGFSVADDRNELAGPAFEEAIKAMALLGRHADDKPNEMIVAVWEDGLGETLPLQAFFYVAGTAGLAVAQRNQQDLWENGRHVVIPIIQLKFSATEEDKADFVYLLEDQVLEMPLQP